MKVRYDERILFLQIEEVHLGSTSPHAISMEVKSTWPDYLQSTPTFLTPVLVCSKFLGCILHLVHINYM